MCELSLPVDESFLRRLRFCHREDRGGAGRGQKIYRKLRSGRYTTVGRGQRRPYSISRPSQAGGQKKSDNPPRVARVIVSAVSFCNSLGYV